jgi:hypothetical protein
MDRWTWGDPGVLRAQRKGLRTRSACQASRDPHDRAVAQFAEGQYVGIRIPTYCIRLGAVIGPRAAGTVERGAVGESPGGFAGGSRRGVRCRRCRTAIRSTPRRLACSRARGRVRARASRRVVQYRPPPRDSRRLSSSLVPRRGGRPERMRRRRTPRSESRVRIRASLPVRALVRCRTGHCELQETTSDPRVASGKTPGSLRTIRPEAGCHTSSVCACTSSPPSTAATGVYGGRSLWARITFPSTVTSRTLPRPCAWSGSRVSNNTSQTRPREADGIKNHDAPTSLPGSRTLAPNP